MSTARVASRPALASRATLLTIVVLGASVVAVLAVLVHTRWTLLLHLDNLIGLPAEVFTFQHAGVTQALLVVEAVFGTLGTTVYTTALVALAWWRGERRVAGWIVMVALTTAVSTTALKLLVRRDRPVWDDPVQTLTSFSHPSGHASAIVAGAACVIVLLRVLLVPTFTCWALTALTLVVVRVVGADRIMLGVHNISDVVGGYALALFWVATIALVHPPIPRRGQVACSLTTAQ